MTAAWVNLAYWMYPPVWCTINF